MCSRMKVIERYSAAMKFVRAAFIQPDVMGSDHCPVGVDVEKSIFG